MPLGAKILTAAAILCILLWGAFLALGAQPLIESGTLAVIYGEHEDFYADAVVYQKVRNETLFLIHLPRARAAYRWWSVDLNDMTISLIGAPRSVGSRKYLLRGDRRTKIDDNQKMGDWYWHFTESGAAFAGNGFMCSVRKAGSN